MLLGELMNSLKLFPFMNKGRLTGTDDLNNVLTSGIYEISAPTTGVLNGKDIQYGILIVFSAGQRIQLLGNGLYGNAYFRTGRDNGRWYDWVSIYWHKIYSKRELGELQLNENYFLVNHMLGEGALYKLNYPKDINVTFDIIGEGNSENADIFSFVSHHVKGLSVVKSIGPNLLKIYKDGDHNYYVYMPVFSRALIYFTNRVSMDNAISATKVDIDISTLTQVGI